MIFRRVSFIVLFAGILLVNSLPAFGWDETGHKITAYIAWQRMTPETREKVVKILLSAPEDSHIGAYYLAYGSRSMESKKREFFMLMSSWADFVRDRALDTRYKKYHKGNWHYDDKFWEWKDGKVVFVAEPEDGGVALEKLAEFSQLIRGTAPDAEKAVAIVWLEHIIGDLHQPLHTSAKVTDSNPKGDQGGNLFFLTPKGTPRDKQENLHSYWDGIIGRNLPNAKDQCDADYIDPIAQDIMKLHPYEKMTAKLNPGKFDLWTKESLDIATTEIYKDLKWFESPTEKYRKRAFEVAQERLALAGYRMGDLFNEAFAAPVVPVSPVSKAQ